MDQHRVSYIWNNVMSLQACPFNNEAHYQKGTPSRTWLQSCSVPSTMVSGACKAFFHIPLLQKGNRLIPVTSRDLSVSSQWGHFTSHLSLSILEGICSQLNAPFVCQLLHPSDPCLISPSSLSTESKAHPNHGQVETSQLSVERGEKAVRR